jgi:hypothetical protein
MCHWNLAAFAENIIDTILVALMSTTQPAAIAQLREKRPVAWWEPLSWNMQTVIGLTVTAVCSASGGQRHDSALAMSSRHRDHNIARQSL